MNNLPRTGIAINCAFGGFNLSASMLHNLNYPSSEAVPRDSPKLIEEIIKYSNGTTNDEGEIRFGNIIIKYIPVEYARTNENDEDCYWEISEYDGYETIHILGEIKLREDLANLAKSNLSNAEIGEFIRNEYHHSTIEHNFQK